MSDVTATVLLGDSLTVLRTLPDDRFQTVVTSPPYFWQRDYGYDGQLGHEESVESYVAGLADVFDEVMRVLSPRGVVFLNLGDTYYSGNGQPRGTDPRSSSRDFMRKKVRAVDVGGWDIPKKSLIGIPWKVAFAMQERGWTLRSSIIWNRVNAFPEPSARDRPHRQYENIFMFSKSRWYDFDRTSLPEEDVWTIPVERRANAKHHAYFPAALVRRCIHAASTPGDHVLDPFVGSGTTVHAALEAGRSATGIDLSPEYIYELRTALARAGYMVDEETP